MKSSWKNLLLLALALIMALSSVAFAEGEALTPGVTVYADEDSITGYSATFVYEDAEAESVDVVGTFAFYEAGEKIGSLPETRYTPDEWKPGLIMANDSDYAVAQPMTKVDGTDYWTATLALPSGHYFYTYNVDGSEEYITDPANPDLTSTAETGGRSGFSVLDVPYDAEKQFGSIDYTFMMPLPEAAGTLAFADYTDINGDLAPLAIYLPYGYDAEREEPYKVLYLCHGGGGNEVEWFAKGNIHYVFDRLIAEGKVEPTIVVAFKNNYHPDAELMNGNLLDYIIPYMEENYNVGAEPADRALAGLSMGGMYTSTVYYDNADQFSLFGILSGCNADVDLTTLDLDKLTTPTLVLGGGCYDFGISMNRADFSLHNLTVKLAALEIPFDYYEVDGGHNWTTWPPLIRIIAENYLWK